MKADWNEIHRIALPPPSPHDLPTPASTLAFDTQQELLWVGNDYGRVTSFHGAQLRRYTSYRGHPPDQGPVKQLLMHGRGVISVAPTSLHLSSRRGLVQWHLEGEAIKDLRCMSFVGKTQSHIIAAGCQSTILRVDVEKGEVVEQIPTEDEYVMIRQSKYICAATSEGSVNLLDADNLRLVKTLNTNNVGICDMDARNNYLVTCGWVNRPQGTPMLAGLANVYDLRAMVQLPPVPFHAGAAHVQMHPKMSTTCILASQTGQLQVVDLMNANTVNLRQINVSTYLTALTLAPSGEALIIADADGYLQLWGSPSKLQFNEFNNEMPEWADTPATVQQLDVDQPVPLSTIGMPYYREQLLSAWPVGQVYEVGHLPNKVDPLLLKHARQNELGVWAPNPRLTRRNQVQQKRRIEASGSSLAAPKFLSEKAKASDATGKENHAHDLQDVLNDVNLNDSNKSEAPVIYRNVEIKYSRFGVDDFDFQYYNKTHFSGLETHIANSYINSLLQLLKFTPLVRNLALQHTASTCMHDTCLLCEMGFLFDTMEKAEGQNCQATNLLKTFSTLPQAARLGLLEDNTQGTPLMDLIQGATRFVLTQISEDFKRIAPESPQFDETFAFDALTAIRCVHCHKETIRPGASNVTDLEYTNPSGNTRHRMPIASFSQILKASIEVQRQTRGWCDQCRRYQQLSTRRSVRGTPDVLLINTALKTAEAGRSWAIPGWLPESIGLATDNGRLLCYEGEELRLQRAKAPTNLKVYDLVGAVADIHSGEHQKSHLVSLIDTNIAGRMPSEHSQWYLFNDFLVRNLGRQEALQFPAAWKTPAILAYQVQSARHSFDESWKANLDTSLLYQDWTINGQAPENCQLLDPNAEAPGAGTYVAIDTEFVALQQEEIEVKADGDREVVRPTRLGLARVSVLRGSGEQEGLPFINEYITIKEEIVDYLTRWSGVEPGDLDPQVSRHPLVPLKVAYKKLWLLVNLGCIFIGHGLPKDFRTINIHVPKAQVVDTVDLFFQKGRSLRKLSLRFLAWYLLQDDIQQEVHDSIEDARTALRLFRKFEEFTDAGIADTMIDEVYREGKKWGYKPPGEALAAASGNQGAGRGIGGDGGSATPSRNRVSGSAARPGGGSRDVAGTLGVPSSLTAQDGRETPEILRGASGRVTPLGRPGASDTFESPLR